MATAKRSTVPDTDRTINIDVPVSGDLSVDEMEAELLAVAEEVGLYLSRTTVLGAKRYPGNRHWHLKRRPDEPGCLDATYWPDGPLMWVSVRRSEPTWVHEEGRRLAIALGERLAHGGPGAGPAAGRAERPGAR